MCRDPRNFERIASTLREHFPEFDDETIRRITRDIYASLFGIV